MIMYVDRSEFQLQRTCQLAVCTPNSTDDEFVSILVKLLSISMYYSKYTIIIIIIMNYNHATDSMMIL